MIKIKIKRLISWDATAFTFFICVVILSVTSDVAASPVINYMTPTPPQMDQNIQNREIIKALPSGSNLGQFSHHEFTRSSYKRLKRSPYPPGFVTWTLKEPCICSPGQLVCRCNSTSSASSEGSQKSRRRRSRKRKVNQPNVTKTI